MTVITQNSPALAAPMFGFPFEYLVLLQGGRGDSWGSAESFCDLRFDASQRSMKCAADINIHPGHSSLSLSVVPVKCL